MHTSRAFPSLLITLFFYLIESLLYTAVRTYIAAAAAHCFTRSCSFITLRNWSSVLKSWRQLHMGHCNWLPQKMGSTGMNQKDMNSLRLTGRTWKLWQLGQYMPWYCSSNGLLASQSFFPKMIGTNDMGDGLAGVF